MFVYQRVCHWLFSSYGRCWTGPPCIGPKQSDQLSQTMGSFMNGLHSIIICLDLLGWNLFYASLDISKHLYTSLSISIRLWFFVSIEAGFMSTTWSKRVVQTSPGPAGHDSEDEQLESAQSDGMCMIRLFWSWDVDYGGLVNYIWYMMIHDDTWWYMMIHDDTWWYMMIHDDVWWYIMIYWYIYIYYIYIYIWDLEIVHDWTTHQPLVATAMHAASTSYFVQVLLSQYLLNVFSLKTLQLDGKIGDHHTQYTMIIIYIYILYIHTYIHTYIPTYLHTYIPTYLHTYIPTYLHTYIPTYLHTYIPTYLHTYIPTYLHTYIPTYLHTYIPT